MISELLKIRQIETAVRVSNTKVEAVRIKDIVKKGVRIYDGSHIGISGAIGDVSDDALIQKATENLTTHIVYPYPVESGTKDHRLFDQNIISPKALLAHAENILGALRTEFPEFDFSEKLSTNQTEYTLSNSKGLDLLYKDSFVSIELILKEKSSANLFDGFIGYMGRLFDEAKFLAFNRTYLEAYKTKVELPEGERLPVFTLQFHELSGFLNKSLNGERYATGSSLFSGQLNETVFNDAITINQNFNSEETYTPFFDHEGCRLENNKRPLIKNGKLVSVFTDKKVADTYNLPHTGAASGDYDGAPLLGFTNLRFEVDHVDAKKALNGQLAILVIVAGGGDFTSDGQFASPVQISFLFDGEKVLGKLPEFQIRSQLKNMLGDDYIGTFETPLYFGDHERIQGYYMDIVR